VTLFEKSQVVGSFLGFSAGGLEFHADLILPYRNYFQSSPMHGQFVLVALENDAEAIVGRITTISAQGRLVSPAGEDYALRQRDSSSTSWPATCPGRSARMNGSGLTGFTGTDS
jgi:hypothetical protein